MAEQDIDREETPENVVLPIDADALDPDASDDPAEPDPQAELAAANDRNLRLQAEVQNQISRGARQLAEQRKYAALDLARDLLPVLDNIDRAIQAAEKDGQSGGMLEGIKLVRTQLVTVLQQHKCEPMDAAAQPFDPDFHEAILQQPSDETPSGIVLQDVQTGYRMHDRVVRASQVIVSSGPAE